MMPECGDIPLVYNPAATDGFRLGLMQDLGLDISDAENPELDDILYMETDKQGGIIAGDNPRSVLLAVYEYLRQNGCRWLFPSADGEFIPMKDIEPVSYRYKPSCRYRGQCNEGAEFQTNMFEAIDFTPKVGMNIFMQEFLIPTGYYNRYYNHIHNEANRTPEPVTPETILQWKRQCESEISKRGLQYHDMGHGWTTDPFGIDSFLQADPNDPHANDSKVSDDQRRFLALVNGERKLYKDRATFTSFCMGNPEAQKRFVDYTVNYAEKHQNVDYLHVWLADSKNQQCECELCQTKTPSDWYILLMNMLDEKLTEKKLKTRIVFIAYLDTTWAPETESLKNPDRFTLLFAPITRSYTQTLPAVATEFQKEKYVRNKMTMPKNLAENFAYLDDWKKVWKGANVAYEYHFWYHQFYDLGGIQLSKRLNEDVRVYKENDVNGIIQDGSQRSFFPTGLAFYTYARSLYDTSLTPEEIAKEYFTCAFGEDWKAFYDYLKELGDAFDVRFLEGEMPYDKEVSPYYNPDHVASLQRVYSILEQGRALIEKRYNNPYRVQTVSVRLLEKHMLFCRLLADALIPKAQGNDDEADRLYVLMRDTFGKEELAIERCYDHSMAFLAMNLIFKKRSKLTERITAAE